MLLLIRWLIFQRSAMTEPNMAVTFNVMILGVLCGYFGSRCLGRDGDVWLIYWRPFAASIYSEKFGLLSSFQTISHSKNFGELKFFKFD